MGTLARDGAPLHQHDSKRNVIEDHTHIECSQNLVKDPSNFMEKGSLGELDVASSVVSDGVVVHHGFKGVLSQGLEVQVAHLHDDFKGHEMNDTMLNSVLVSKHVDANTFAEESAKDLVKA